MTHQLFVLGKQALTESLTLPAAWYCKFFLTLTSTPTPTYTTAALDPGSVHPVEVTAGSDGRLPAVYLDPAITYKCSVYNSADVFQYTIDPCNDVILSQSVIGALLYPQTAAESAAGVTPTNYAYPPLNLRRYGGAPGAGDNTTAMDAAEAVCAALGGGFIYLDTVGEWRMNWTCTTRGVVVMGVGGAAEFDAVSVRPYNIATGPAITFGDGTNRYYYNGLINIHMSGTDGTAGADRQSAKSASHCLLLKGGIINFTSLNSWYYNGIRTVSCEPSATQPVTQINFIGGGARNDLNDSASARTLYGFRLADPGYFTDIVFTRFKLNGPGGGVSPTVGCYLGEFDGTAAAMIIEFTDCYADLPADAVSPATVCHGILLKGTVQIKCKGLQLDPGTTGAVVIESDQAVADLSRIIVGELRHGGQKVLFAGPTVVTMPAESEVFSHRERVNTPFLTGLAKFTTLTDPYDVADTAPYLDTDSATGPVTLNRADWSVKTAGKGLRVAEGSNAKQGLSVLVGGTVTVSNTSVTANSRILLTSNVDGGTPGWLRVSAITAATSFVITSSNGADTSSVAWQIFEPA